MRTRLRRFARFILLTINQEDESEVKKRGNANCCIKSYMCTTFYVRQAGCQFLLISLQIEMFSQSFYAASFDT